MDATTNVGKETTLVRATKTVEYRNGGTCQYHICFKMEKNTGKILEVLDEGGSNGEKKLPLYYLIHLARQLCVHVNAPMPRRYGATVNFTFLGADGTPALHINENNRTVDINIDVAAKVWLPYYELKRFACYVHWLSELEPERYRMAEHGEKDFKSLRSTEWTLEFD